MVKLAGPCMSMSASGKLANAIVFSRWKGRAYARQLVTPANPKSGLQVSTRAMLKFLSQRWAGNGAIPQASWDDLADLSNISPFNAYVGRNASRWREFQAPSQTYPAAETGTPVVGTLDTATGGPSYMDLAFTITTLEDVWGAMIFRSPTTTFASSRANCIAIIEIDSTGALVYTDSNLAAGEYWYDCRFFSKEGLLDDEEGEVTGTVT